MTYVVSHIHGCYDKFRASLRENSFSDNDVMYIPVDVREGSIIIDCGAAYKSVS